MAFEAIVKRQIEKLRNPAVKCVDMVMSELTNVIKKCSSQVKWRLNATLIINFKLIILFHNYKIIHC